MPPTHLDTNTMTHATTVRDRSTSSIVLDALAEAIGTEPVDLDPPLYRIVDGDALDRLCGDDASISVEFEYDGHGVVVRKDGTVTVDGTVYDTTEECQDGCQR